MTRTLVGAPLVAAAMAVAIAIALTLTGTAMAAPEAEPTIDFIVLRSDTLIGLSNTVLVSPTAWREVASLNKLRNANRISPGQRLRIPLRLLRSEATGATLASASGDVRIGDAPAVAGATLTEGQSVQTGANGSAVIALADGSRVRLPPSSLAQVAASRNYGVRSPGGSIGAVDTNGKTSAAADAPSHWFAGTLRVLRGSVEVFATKVLRAKPLEVVTPTAVVGVRGTQYRVGFDEGTGGLTHAEVLEGAVRFDAAKAGSEGAALRDGFGAAVDAVRPAPIVAALLPAPDLASLAERFERPIVRFTLPDATTPLRAQIAADAGFEKIVADQVFAAGTEVRFAGLDDAGWYLRARRVDAQGIEGFDAVKPFVLKARPEPPAYRAPRLRAKQSVGAVEFSWAPNAEATKVRLQLAEDAAFTRIAQDLDNLDASAAKAEIAAPGTYHWRLASIRPDGDHGPFGDPQSFELRPLPEPPAGGPSADGTSLVFQWSGRAEDRQQVELARDADFKEIVEQAELKETQWTLPKPNRGGRYYFRYRSVEPDGFVSPYSPKLIVDLPRDWSGLGLLLPLLFIF
jgi:hypothetical protein